MEQTLATPTDTETPPEYRLDDERMAKALVAQIVEDHWPLWTRGDGYGGMIHVWLDEAAESAGLVTAGMAAALRRAERVNPRVVVPDDLRWGVWERDDFTCRGCGTRRNLTIDHVIPVSAGGSSDPDNLQTLCRPCNSKKGVR